MSSFEEKFRNKKTGEIETVFCWDDYFGRHRYGYVIKGHSRVLTEGEFMEKYERMKSDASSD